jgi:REP-associated tyrosine transposase
VNATQHLIQRRRGSWFSCAQERLSYMDLLCTFAAHYECAVHAYVLMENHVHLLVTSPDGSAGADLARALAGDEPEIRPVHARRYLLACMRYIELNPVRANIVARAHDYRWSSYRANALGYTDPIVTPPPLYYALGRSTEARREAYARLVHRGFARPDRVSP